MFEHFEEFNGQSEINHEVDYAKFLLGIDKPNAELTSDEVKRVCRQIGSLARDTTYEEDGKPIFNYLGLTWILWVCLYCFPKYYGEFELSEPN